jgi:hypothetical protein
MSQTLMTPATSAARYESLAEYEAQFAEPTSAIGGIFTFTDPLWPERSILLECTAEREDTD